MQMAKEGNKKTMKKLLITSLIIVFLGLILYISFIIYPRDIQFDTNGIKYRLGNENIGTEKSIHITIQGKLTSSIFGNKTFKGTINLEGEEIPVPQNERDLVLNFHNELNSEIIFSYIEDGQPFMYSYGSIFINKNFSKESISVYDKNHDNTKGTWVADNGLMIAAPASNREQALKISNELMSKYLRGYILK